ncbi:MAG: hypothetical protein EPGJADBJ_02750 [Saprospiraceae bacterium]|nr:hypothetical protein [Saprospiraceae bacterium]
MTVLMMNAPLDAQQWQQVNELPAGQMSALFVKGDTLFVAGLNKLYFTYDGGDTWDSSAVISPTLDIISAVRYSQGRLYVGTEFEGVYTSANGGQSWQTDNNGLAGLGATNISSLAIRGDSLYAGTYGAKVFVKKISTNSNWSAYNTGMPWGNVESLTNIDGRLFAGSGGNATVSVQESPGHTWTEMLFAQFSGEMNSFLGVVRQGDVLLAAGNSGLYRSADDGANWTPYNPGTGFLGSAHFVVAGDRVIANLAKPVGLTFLQYTDDYGQNWQHFEPPITGSYGFDIALCNGKLYSARSNGLWRISLTTRVDDPAGEKPEPGQNFPNPFSGSTTIPVTLTQQTWMELSVFDAGGAYIRTIWRGEKPAGAHQIEFYAGDLPPGIYVCRLMTETGVASRLMTIAR